MPVIMMIYDVIVSFQNVKSKYVQLGYHNDARGIIMMRGQYNAAGSVWITGGVFCTIYGM